MPFWKYYHNQNAENKAKAAWGSRIHRVFHKDNSDCSAQILYDIVEIKKGTPDAGKAKDLYEHFCKDNNIDQSQLPPASGALTRQTLNT
jgi:hypothetical protein